jgi:hypothetical protein
MKEEGDSKERGVFPLFSCDVSFFLRARMGSVVATYGTVSTRPVEMYSVPDMVADLSEPSS